MSNLRTTLLSAAGIAVIGMAACKKEAPTDAPQAKLVARPAPAQPAQPGPDGKVAVAVVDEGFVPNRIAARAGQPLILAVTRKTKNTCANEITFFGQEGKTELPLDRTVEVTYVPKQSGTVKFGCAMGMMIGGVIDVSP